MNEIMLGIVAILSLLIPGTSAIFYMLGGRSMEELAKWKLDFLKNRTWGRLIAPLWLSGGLIGLSLLKWAFNWGFLACIPALLLVSHVGHGYNAPPGENPLKTLIMKVFRRSISSVLCAAAMLPFAIWSGEWIVFACQAGVSLIVCNIFGILNPKEAPEEEAVIAFFKYCFSPFLF